MTAAPHHISTEQLNAYIDGPLTEQERSAIASHLATCADCGAEMTELQATVRLLGELPQYQPRRSLQLGVEFAAGRPQVSPVVRLLPVVRSLSVAAVIVFMVAAGAFLLEGSTADVDQPTASRSETSGASEASQGSGDAGAPVESGEQSNRISSAQGDERLIDRGEAASSGDDPLEDLTNLEQAPAPAADQDAEPGLANRLTADFGQAVVIGLGVLALVLVSLWVLLVRLGRRNRQPEHVPQL